MSSVVVLLYGEFTSYSTFRSKLALGDFNLVLKFQLFSWIFFLFWDFNVPNDGKWALLIEDRALLIECRALFIECRAFLTEHRALLIEYKTREQALDFGCLIFECVGILADPLTFYLGRATET